jgi:hypothetical protein
MEGKGISSKVMGLKFMQRAADKRKQAEEAAKPKDEVNEVSGMPSITSFLSPDQERAVAAGGGGGGCLNVSPQSARTPDHESMHLSSQEHWIAPGGGAGGCMVVMEGGGDLPASTSGRLSFKGFKTGPKSAYQGGVAAAQGGDDGAAAGEADVGDEAMAEK